MPLEIMSMFLDRVDNLKIFKYFNINYQVY